MKAVHKYKNSKKPEYMRRIIQSMGYKFTIWDMPHMIALMQRAGIDIVDNKHLQADSETISL